MPSAALNFQSLSPPVFDPHAWAGAWAVLALAWLIGRALFWRAPLAGWGANALLRLMAGVAALPAVVLVAGQFEGALFSGAPGWLALAAGVGFGAEAVAGAHRALKDPGQGSGGEICDADSGLWPYLAHWAALGGWIALACWWLLLLGPLFCPPLNYDVLEYHLGIVPNVFELGRVAPVPHVFYTAQPIGMEMLYTLAAAVEGTAWGWAPGALQWLLAGLGTLLIERALAGFRVPAAARPVAVLFFLTLPVPFKLQLGCMTDWFGVVLLAGGVWGFQQFSALERPASRWGGLVFLGMVTGGAMGSKWTHAGTVAGPLFLFAAVLAWEAAPQARRLPATLKGAVLCLCVSLMVWGPWPVWLRSVAGNPFAPFMAGAFPAPEWGAERLAFLMATHEPLRPWQGLYWTNLLARLTVAPPRAWLALAGIAAGPVVFMILRGETVLRRRAGAAWAGLAAALLLWGQLHHAADRFLAPVLFLALLLIAMPMAALAPRLDRAAPELKNRLRLGALACWAALVLVAGMGWRQAAPVFSAIPWHAHAFGKITADAFLENEFTLGPATAGLFKAANALPADAHILAINEARRYPFRRRVTLASVFDRNPIEDAVHGAKTSEEIRARLVEAGYTHLLVNDWEMVRILRMHTPARLTGDPAFESVRDDDRALMERYWGYTAFSGGLINGYERDNYDTFLQTLLKGANWSLAGPSPRRPAMWIAPL